MVNAANRRPVDPSSCRPVGSLGSLEYTILGIVNAATHRPLGTLGSLNYAILGTVNVSTCRRRPVDLSTPELTNLLKY